MIPGPSDCNSGKADPVQFRGFLNRALLAFKNGHFASSFLLLGIGFLEASKNANLSFKRPSTKPHLHRTGSAFALPSNWDHFSNCCGLRIFSRLTSGNHTGLSGPIS